MRVEAVGSLLVALAVLTAACGEPADRLEDDAPIEAVPSVHVTSPDDIAAAVTVFAPDTGESAQNPAYAPDGEALLATVFREGYNDGPADLVVVDPDTGDAALLFAGDESDAVSMPGRAWDAATDRIVFSWDRDGPGDIWVVSGDGRDPQLLVHSGDRYLQEPTWSPGGDRVAFEALDEAADAAEIWVVGSDGHGPRPLTGEAAGAKDCRQPSFSPTDELIVAQCRRIGTDEWRLATIDADDGEMRVLDEAGTDATDPSWSPDGSWLVFSTGTEDGAQPAVFALEGGTVIPLPTVDGYAGAPSWSPDGTTIAYEASAEPDEATVIRTTRVPAAATPGERDG